MKKIILVGRSECGKTTLTQALKHEKIHYHKTQYVNRFDVIIDTPGEYIQTKNLGSAIAMYTFEADVVGLLLSAREPYSLYPPAVTPVANRPVIGIVTQINKPDADVKQAERWLRLAGCEKVFFVDSKTGEGVWQIIDYLREDGDVMPWEEE
ncbi:MAG: ethanolamine utilization protein EutP [Clostridia bacterium]|nr:ethanolamine utilization protein EutP [Clostridia bacterium]MBQ3472094.1 ethanolamine utilization protein EutP [Clostridia bacterium]MBQ6557803.1 ethanolamine utilization protein EutP [Clostridia bacterium]MBQ9598309.1 ethanolamine utilization protein EutP [Clostridia bacterium]MBR0089623.1 ethanolamine utilization protein EutP [Clostridia bacterium]